MEKMTKASCSSCAEYDLIRECCMREWNNLDPAYCIPDRDKKRPDDICDNYVEEVNA